MTRTRRSFRLLALPAVPLTILGSALVATGADAASPATVAVARGDSLWSIAQRSGTTVTALQSANGLRSFLIHPGQVLRLPARSASSAGATAGLPSTPRSVAPGRHVIRPGDSLWAISRKYGVSLESLRSANAMTDRSVLLPGRTVVIPHAGPATTTALTPVAVVAPKGSAPSSLVAKQGGPVPTAIERNPAAGTSTRPSPDEVRRTVAAVARQHGVDPSLAVAIAYNESRFRQDAVSPTNAIGAMQVLASTARWIGTNLAGRPLNPYVLTDNATAGVLYLKYLLERAPLDTAIGAYYQGLGGITRQGPLPATTQYVANVKRWQAQFR